MRKDDPCTEANQRRNFGNVENEKMVAWKKKG